MRYWPEHRLAHLLPRQFREQGSSFSRFSFCLIPNRYSMVPMGHSLLLAQPPSHSLPLGSGEQETCMTTLAFAILPAIPLLAWMLLAGWSANTTEGEILLRVPVPVLARLKMLWLPIGMSLLVLAFGVVAGRISWWICMIYLGMNTVVLAIPVSYTLTTVGIRAGKGVFRRWTEFAGVRRSPSGAVLQGAQRASSYPIFLSGNREDDDFVLTLKHLVQDSYKGRATARERMRGSATHSHGETSTTSSISH